MELCDVPVCDRCLTDEASPHNRSISVNDDCEYCENKLYSGLSRQQVNTIRGCLSLCRSGPRQPLFHAGERSAYLYVVREGQLKLTRRDIDGHERLLYLAGPGHFLGFDTIASSTYRYSAETLTPSVFCRIQHEDIVRFLNQEPRIALNVLLAVNDQLAQARDLIGVLGQKTAIEKIAALLLNLYPPVASGDKKILALHLSRHEMAAVLGLTVETVSRFMAGLRRQGIIDAPPGRILIRARARLQALAGGHPRPARAKLNSRRVAARTASHLAAI